MPFTLTMPKLSPTMEEGTISRWCKGEGDFVDAGDLLMEIATDKATVEHNALDSGYLRKVIVPDGGEAVVNQPIAVFTEEKDESIEGYEPEGVQPEEEAALEVPAEEGAPKSETPKPKASQAMAMAQFEPEPPLEDYRFPTVDQWDDKRLFASPLARRLAKEQGLDLSTVKGSGPRGRIMQRDLEHAQPSGTAVFGQRSSPEHAPGSFEEIALTPMRKSIATRLQQAKSSIPHFSVIEKINVASMIETREQLKTFGVKITYNDMIVKAAALALREHPSVNSAFNSVNQTIAHFKTIDVCVAVSVEGGLITPIIRHTDHKNLGQISSEIRSLAKRAKDGKLEPHEYKGGSFTVSNLGMFGVEEFHAIINPPQSAILAVAGMKDEAIVKDGQLVAGKTMKMTLCSDHRVIDGALSAQFLQTMKRLLENPAILLL